MTLMELSVTESHKRLQTEGAVKFREPMQHVRENLSVAVCTN